MFIDNSLTVKVFHANIGVLRKSEIIINISLHLADADFQSL